MFTENFEVSNMLSYMWNFGTEGWSGSTWYKMGSSEGSALAFRVLAKCSTSRARVAEMTLPHSVVDTPVFMPVGTQGTLKGLLPEQLVAMDCRIMLSNTYHLGNRLFSKDDQHFVHCMKSSHKTKILGRVLKSWKQLGVFTSIQKQNHSNSHFKSSISSICAQMSHAKVYGLAKIPPHRLRRFSDGLTPRGLVFLHPIVPLTDIF